jgi:hypothetical protein
MNQDTSFHAGVRVLISKDSLGDELNRVISLIKDV